MTWIDGAYWRDGSQVPEILSRTLKVIYINVSVICNGFLVTDHLLLHIGRQIYHTPCRLSTSIRIQTVLFTKPIWTAKTLSAFRGITQEGIFFVSIVRQNFIPPLGFQTYNSLYRLPPSVSAFCGLEYVYTIWNVMIFDEVICTVKNGDSKRGISYSAKTWIYRMQTPQNRKLPVINIKTLLLSEFHYEAASITPFKLKSVRFNGQAYDHGIIHAQVYSGIKSAFNQ